MFTNPWAADAPYGLIISGEIVVALASSPRSRYDYGLNHQQLCLGR
jgi:hypothetical protein